MERSRAPSLGDLGPSPEVDAELMWFFAADDGDLMAETNFGRLLSPVTDDGDWRTPEQHAAAIHQHKVLRARLRSMPSRQAGILQCAYLPRPWPHPLLRVLGRVTGIVVRLACDRATWPEARGEQLVVDAHNAVRLAVDLHAGTPEERAKVRELRREAQRLFGKALFAYEQARWTRFR